MKKRNKIFRWTGKILLGIGALAFVLMAVMTAPYWQRRWVTYPQLEKARAELWTQYRPTENVSGRESYKGVLHAHNYWSHDSRGVLEEILPAAKKAKLDFIFFSDHIRSKQDSFPRSLHGIYDGILLESGTETSSGLMATPLRSTVLDWDRGDEEVIRQVVESGGFVGYVHTEEEHAWDNPDYQAMEIYNIHTDLKDEKESFLLDLILNSFINGRKYRHWAYRELFDEQHEILQRWDALNRQRRIVGFAAVDAHNNQGFRARYTDEGTVEWVGPNAKTIKVTEPGWKEKWLLGTPDDAGWAFRWEVDTYFDSFNFVNTHVFCDTLSSLDIINNLVKGRAYIAFESLAEANGFQFYAQNSDKKVVGIMGDSVEVAMVDRIVAQSPLPVRFVLIKDGERIDETAGGYDYTFDPGGEPGNYRLEASIRLRDAWTPWVYANPIYLHR
jgi:hypothetical protein